MRMHLATLLLTIIAAHCQGITLYGPENIPVTPSVDDLPKAPAITRDGITWTFDRLVPVGQFVNGDYYFVGPATVTQISPTPASGRNGSVLNLPPINNRSGFDSRTLANRYDASMRDDPPIAMQPGDSLVSTISVGTVGDIKCMLRSSDSTYSPVRTASILTCLAEPVAADAFRPSYCDRDQNIYYARYMRREKLPSLPSVSSTRTLSEFEGYFRRPWIDTLFYEYDFPIEYMAQYPRETLRATGMGSLLLMEDFTAAQKEALLVYLVQYGIDLYGIAEAGYPGWYAHGGHGNGRKWPIVMAGVMLGVRDMAWISQTHPQTAFSEDQQTMYDNGWTGANVVYAGHYGSDGLASHPGWGRYEHLQPAQWEGDSIGESYRRCCTSIGWVQVGLAAMMLDAQSPWSHPAFFDYCDRWMTEDDTEHLAEILRQNGHDFSASWARQGQCWDAFPEDMWHTYRDALDVPKVHGRYLMYNNSALDGNDWSANAADDAAIATDKTALLAGQTADFANYSSYSRGINAVVVDIDSLPVDVDAGDFYFRTGTAADTQQWSLASQPQEIAVRRGAGVNGSDRVTIIFPDDSISNCWLQVTVKANARTGLTKADVFYFGSAIGETGNSSAEALVNNEDVRACVSHPAGLNLDDFIELKQHYGASVPVGYNGDYNLDGKVTLDDFIILKQAYGTVADPMSPYDINRDGRVNSEDSELVKQHFSGILADQLILIENPF